MSTESKDVTNDERSEGAEGSSRDASDTTLGRGERIASAVAGGTLLAVGVRRRSLAGAAATVAGGWLCYRGLAGERFADRLSDANAEDSSDRRDAKPTAETVETTRSVTVGRPADELYDLWRDPETMRRVFAGLVTVTARGEDRWNWAVTGPLGWGVSWDTRIAEARPGEALRWETLEDAAAWNEGAVQFRPAPADRGTEVTFEFSFDPPGGQLGGAMATYLGVVPGTLVEKALDRFKSLAETGEIPTLEGNPSARGEGDLL